eukprot:4510900-Amphidinium_carterae.1
MRVQWQSHRCACICVWAGSLHCLGCACASGTSRGSIDSRFIRLSCDECIEDVHSSRSDPAG